MKAKEIFDSLRVTTMEVANPLIFLAAHRGKMIKAFVEFMIESPADQRTPEMIDILKAYNDFAVRDQELLDIAQGKASEELL